MQQHQLLTHVTHLLGGHDHYHVTGINCVALRFGSLIRTTPQDLEAGDIIIIPPSNVTRYYPSEGYIHGCIEKCWPLVRNL